MCFAFQWNQIHDENAVDVVFTRQIFKATEMSSPMANLAGRM